MLGLSSLLVSLSPIILLPFLTNNLSAENFGVWVQFTITVTIIPPIAILGLPYTFVRYMSTSRKLEDFQESFYSIAFVIVLINMGLALILFFLSGLISMALFNNNFGVALILPVSLFFAALILFFFDFFRTIQKNNLYNFFYLTQAYLMVVFSAFFVTSGYGIFGAVIGFLLAQILIFFAMFILIIKYIGFILPSFSNIREYLNFGIPTIPSNLSTWILDASDRYIIGFLIGLSAVGFYSGGYTLGSLIVVLLSPFYTLLLPILSQYYFQEDFGSIKRLLNHSIKLFLAVTIPLTFILSVLSTPILLLLSTPEIANNSHFLVPIVAIGGIFYGLYGIVTQIIILEKKTRLTGNIWLIITILNLLLDVILGYRFGIIGVAFTSLIMFIIAFFLTSHYAFKFINCDFYYSFIIKAISSSTLVSIILLLFNPQGVINIILSLISSIILYILIMLLLKGIKLYEIQFFVDIILEIIYFNKIKTLLKISR